MTSPLVTAATGLRFFKEEQHTATVPFSDINYSISRSICGSKHGSGRVEEGDRRRPSRWENHRNLFSFFVDLSFVFIFVSCLVMIFHLAPVVASICFKGWIVLRMSLLFVVAVPVFCHNLSTSFCTLSLPLPPFSSGDRASAEYQIKPRLCDRRSILDSFMQSKSVWRIKVLAIDAGQDKMTCEAWSKCYKTFLLLGFLGFSLTFALNKILSLLWILESNMCQYLFTSKEERPQLNCVRPLCQSVRVCLCWSASWRMDGAFK